MNSFAETTIRFGGRTLEFKVYVNTDESMQAVFERVQKAVKSVPGAPMTIITAGVVPVEQAKGLWEATIAAMEAEVDRDAEKK
jgi:negative regulator of replication initiation